MTPGDTSDPQAKPCGQSARTGADLAAHSTDLIDMIPALVTRTDAAGQTTYCNRAWCEFRGVEPEADGGFAWLRAVHPNDAASVMAKRARAVRKREVAHLDYRLQRADRSFARVTEVFRPIEGDPAGGFISAAVETGAAAAAGDLAPVWLIHDLRTLLTSVVGQTDLAIRFAQSEDPRLGNALAAVASASRHAVTLSREALRAASDDAPAIRLDEELRHAEPLLRVLIDADAELRLDIAEPREGVRITPSKFSQVLINLVANASDALEGRPGAITVRLSEIEAHEPYLSGTGFAPRPRPGPCALLEVADTGMGMTPDVAARAFEPFFSTKPGGHGIGLAAVREVVASSGGGVEILSQPGSGTSVRVLLPAVHAHDAPAIEPTARAVPLRVLLVDDVAPIRAMSATALGLQGHSGFEAASGDDALARAKHLLEAGTPPHAAVIDDRMPGKNGQETARALRALVPDIVLVRSSGVDGTAPVGPIGACLFQADLPKPFRPSELVALLERLRPAR